MFKTGEHDFMSCRSSRTTRFPCREIDMQYRNGTIVCLALALAATAGAQPSHALLWPERSAVAYDTAIHVAYDLMRNRTRVDIVLYGAGPGTSMTAAYSYVGKNRSDPPSMISLWYTDVASPTDPHVVAEPASFRVAGTERFRVPVQYHGGAALVDLTLPQFLELANASSAYGTIMGHEYSFRAVDLEALRALAARMPGAPTALTTMSAR